jgi:hypothetical protein
MEEAVVKELTSACGEKRIAIMRRSDGSFTYRHQSLDCGEWTPLGPICGIFDSALTAETEAMQKVAWLTPRWQ